MTASRHAEISGAGFAGLVAAAALAQRGWSVRVHEKGPEVRAFGAGIWIWTNGWRVLKAVGAYERTIEDGYESPSIERYDQNGKLLMSPVRFADYGTQMVTVVRQKLIEALLEKCVDVGVEVIVNSEVVGAAEKGELHTADGKTYAADLVIGADGIHSNVRDSLKLTRRRNGLAYGGTRLLIPRSEDEMEDESDHVISYLNGERRLLYTPCSRTQTYLCFTVRPDDTEARAIPVNKKAWIRTFPKLEHLIDRVGDDGRWDRYEVIRLKSWSRGRVAIVGDAAHAMAPSLGQGGGCAMMNALSLADAVESVSDILGALTAWEDRERPLTERAQHISSMFSGQRTDWRRGGIFETACHQPTGAEGIN